jgi:polysaccharide export outer membrane protein
MKNVIVALACTYATLICTSPKVQAAGDVYAATSAPVDEVRTAGKDAQDAAPQKLAPQTLAAPDKMTGATISKTQATSPTSSYFVRPGDLLRITVWKEAELDRDTLVLPDGTIDFPLIGSFEAQRKTTAQLQSEIKHLLTPYIPAASVTVILKETRGNSISIIGQVARPGDVIMNRDMSVMQALSQVGGLTPYADEDIIILRKVAGKEVSIEFDYSAVADGRKLESNITLLPGDVIIVPTASLF